MAANGVLDILRDIETDTLRNAAPLPLKRDTRPEWQGLGFQISGVRLVAPLSEVSEILTPPRVTALPRVKDWMLGIANVRGRLIPVIDLHRFMGIATTVPRTQWRVLVVEQGETIAGLLVEQSLGMQHFLDDSFEEGQPEGLDAIHPYIQGAYRHGGRVFYVVSLTSLIRDEKFNDVAS
ncbi:MAG: purine-binding chemotaxis protein CheW [Gammaproteobacteria bacterium]|nr:MAG: purine-binding chemotaxis protein CheW [Gammaproteobacteria bacterium]TDJ42043.1 MAG: purine-binding chemotaxis protein CheW [Gammaproteobacteria bacterium]